MSDDPAPLFRRPTASTSPLRFVPLLEDVRGLTPSGLLPDVLAGVTIAPGRSVGHTGGSTAKGGGDAMTDEDRRHGYAQVLGGPRWNHASAHCACDVDDPDGRGFTTEMCRRNYDRAVRERDHRLDALLALVDAEVAAASRRPLRRPSLVATRARLSRPAPTSLRLPRPALPRLRLRRSPTTRIRLTPALSPTGG